MPDKYKKKFGLRKEEKIRRKKEIDRLFLRGQRFRCSKLLIIYLPAVKQKVGFIASKKIGGAVKRNRIKRILREAYRMNKEIFKELEVIFYAQGIVGPAGIHNAFLKFHKVKCRNS